MRHSVSRIVLLLLGSTAIPAVCQAQSPAAAPTAPRPEFHAQAVRPNLYVLSGSAGNVAVWTGPTATVLVDDGTAALAPQLLEAVGRIAKSPVRFVVDTHWHPDHSGGNEALAKAGAIIVAHESVRERMGETQVDEDSGARVAPASAAALPVVTFPDSMALQLDGERMALVHVAAAHTDADVIVRWQEADAVHLGDLYYNGGYPPIDVANGGSLAGLVAALEAVLARIDAQTVVIPGHGAVSTRTELAAYRDMLVAVGRKVRAQVEAGSSLDEVLALKLSADYDERYGKGAVTPERFIRTLYRDLTRPRSAR